MTSSESIKFFTLANEAMKNGLYTEAIELYNSAYATDGALASQIQFNLSICYERLACEYKPQNIIVQEQPLTSNSMHLMSNPEILISLYRGHIDAMDENAIHGWIYDSNNVARVVQLDLYGNGVLLGTASANLPRHDVKMAGEAKAECGFLLEFGTHVSLTEFNSFEVYISGTKELAFKEKLETSKITPQIDRLSKLAKIVRKENEQTNDPSLNWITNQLIPYLFQQVRNNLLENFPEDGIHKIDTRSKKSEIVDIIIPVYEGLEETIGCINSALNAKNKTPHRIIVINDASPNTALTVALRSHVQDHSYVLLENAENLGFVGTINRGIALSEDRDVILLNSDTVVPDHWIDQMFAVAYSDPIIGTVTPFSNNATICSYPRFCQDNAILAGHDVNTLNRIFFEVNGISNIDIPTAHGFCMLIKRAVVDNIGHFDHQKWGKGYGEENDFSLRAEKHGWRNAMALGTFVQHHGSVSFAGNKEEFIKKNLKILEGMYPDYTLRVLQFIKNDPVRKARNAVTRALLKTDEPTKKRMNKRVGRNILFITLNIGGGTSVATSSLSSQLAREGVGTLYLTSLPDGNWRLSKSGDDHGMDYCHKFEFPQLMADLRAMDVWHVHYHSTLEFSKEVWEIPSQLSCEYDVTIHDYMSICPRVNLVNHTRRYCGEPNTGVCNKCVKENGGHDSLEMSLGEFDWDVEKWRVFHGSKLSRARRIFAPSRDTAMRLERYFPELKIDVRPHPEKITRLTSIPRSSEKITNVIFLGAIGIHKGFDYLVGCAEHAQVYHLPIKFHVIGYTADDNALANYSNVKLYGQYESDTLPALLKQTKANVAALLSVCPETFSYTFSEAQQHGLKVISFDLGALQERIKNESGVVIPLYSSFEDICHSMITLSASAKTQITNGKVYSSISRYYYDFEKTENRLA